MSTVDDSAAPTARIDRLGVLASGAVAGAAAWLTGYLVVYVSRADAISESLRGVGFVSEVLGGGAIPAWKGVAWLFANAHFVDARLSAPIVGTRSFNAVTGEGSGLLLALPPVVLVLAGALAAWSRRGRSGSAASGADGRGLGRGSAAMIGAAVVVGYLPLSAASAFLTDHAIGTTEATIALDPVTAVLLAGVVYPVVFGAIGAVLAGELT